MKRFAAILVVLVIVLFGGFAWRWIFCYEWCPYGTSLLITRKTGQPAEKDHYAKEGQQGVMQELLGPGRYLNLNPYTYTVTKVKDIVVPAGSLCVVKNNIGEDLPPGRFLAEPTEKGTQRRVLTPGAWRVNTFGQQVSEPQLATVIKPGYVGVQTLRESRTVVVDGKEVTQNNGVLDDVLQPGYYNINPKQIRVDEVEIGYRNLEISSKVEDVEVNGRTVSRFVPGTGVSFPLADGKEMCLDFTVVWGIFPQDAPRIIREYGTIDMVEQKIIEPQVLSICKNAGSNFTTKEFIEGATREKFQQTVTKDLVAMGDEKGIHFLIALVRGFHPAEDIKATIQARMIAEEEKDTLLAEQKRDTIAAELEQAKRRVDVAVKDYDAETEALVQEELERGKKRAAEIRAAADRSVAELARETAELDAQIVKITGQAEADVIEAQKKAEATRLMLLIQAYGGPEAYNLATFAENLPKNLSIEYRYSGPGTFWTDMKNPNVSILKDQEQKAAEPRK